MASLYIHVPFCARKCAYCDFTSFDNKTGLIDEYFKALWKEIEIVSGLHGIRGVSTVFFGGGTPSFVDAATIAKTLEAVQKHIGIQPDAEITIEANPNSLERDKLKTYLAAGVNRLSMGLQSAEDRLLQFLGRLHTRESFERAYREAREAGFANISVDLIYGLPTQTLDEWQRTLAYTISMEPQHVSAYSLTIEKGTPLHRDLLAGKVREADEEDEREMYHMAVGYLKSKGLYRYEISNFARPGFESRHNLAYWLRDDYLGIGAAAHSCVGDVRFANTADLEGYISCLRSHKTAYNTREELDTGQRELEFIMLRLRLAEGFTPDEYQKQFGRDFAKSFARPLEKLIKAGLLRDADGRITLTDRGFDLQNTVVLELLNNM